LKYLIQYLIPSLLILKLKLKHKFVMSVHITNVRAYIVILIFTIFEMYILFQTRDLLEKYIPHIGVHTWYMGVDPLMIFF